MGLELTRLRSVLVAFALIAAAALGLATNIAGRAEASRSVTTATRARSMAERVFETEGMPTSPLAVEEVTGGRFDQERWVVTSTEGSRVTVDRWTGRIIGFETNRAAGLRRRVVLDASPLPDSAQRRLAALGLAVPPRSPHDVALLRDDDGRKLTSYRWLREVGGVAFRDDSTEIVVEPVTGRVVSYRRDESSLQPSSSRIHFTPLRALDLATPIAARLGGECVDQGHLMVVNPNGLWSETGMHRSERRGRLAWVFRIETSEGDGELWLDAVTGELLGGDLDR